LIGFDTNILVYALDVRSPERHARAERVVGTALLQGAAFVPLQVLAEFQHVAVRKLGMSPVDALRAVETWSAAAAVEPYGMADLRAAAAAQAEHGLPLWDALIWAVCDRAGVEVLASEDFQNGRRLGRVTFLSPFDPANAPRLGLGASG
jgi:predicted nucleic acid-binding protein